MTTTTTARNIRPIAENAVAANKRKSDLEQAAALTLTFFTNDNGAPVADLYLGKRRLLATTHPATIVAALFAMDRTELTVVTAEGSHSGTMNFLEAGADFWPIEAMNLRMQLNPRLYQFRHLAPTQSYAPLLEGLDLFAYENWYNLTEVADEHLRAAHHHLPKDLLKRPLLTSAPKGWKKTVARRNGWIYFPFC